MRIPDAKLDELETLEKAARHAEDKAIEDGRDRGVGRILLEEQDALLSELEDGVLVDLLADVREAKADLAKERESRAVWTCDRERYHAERLEKAEAERDRYRMALEAVSLRLHGPSHFLGNEVSVIVSAALAKAGAP